MNKEIEEILYELNDMFQLSEYWKHLIIEDYKTRIDKAIEYINKYKNQNWYIESRFTAELLNILNGSDKGKYYEVISTEQFNIQEELNKKIEINIKYKEVLDKIKEIINNKAFFDPAMPNCNALGQKATLEILKLLEEIE